MTSIIFYLKTKPGKNLEFLQSVGTIITSIRNTKGCVSIDFKQRSEDKERFSLRLDWENKKYLLELLKIKEYEFLEGAILILCESPTIEVINTNNIGTIDVAKNKEKSIRSQIINKLNSIIQTKN
jgi:quinol monooxygenase YgiN